MSKHIEPARVDAESNDAQLKNRRDFLKSLGKWSTIIIGGVALGGMVAPKETAGWLNGGGGWVNARGGGGGWINRSGGGGAGSTGRAAVHGLTVEAIDRVGCLKTRCVLEPCHLQHPRAFV